MKSTLPKIFAKRYFPYIDLVSIFLAFCLTYAAMPLLKVFFSPYPDLPLPSIQAFSWTLIIFLPVWFVLIRIEKGYRNLIEWSYLTDHQKNVQDHVVNIRIRDANIVRVARNRDKPALHGDSMHILVGRNDDDPYHVQNIP